MFKQDSKMYHKYLVTLVDRTYKILPLYEEKNEGLFANIQSLIYELYGLDKVIEEIGSDADYITLIATLESLSDDALVLDDNHKEVKREVFKCLSIIKRMEDKATGKSGE